MSDREFIYQLLADLRNIRDRGRPKTEDINKLLDQVRDHLVDSKGPPAPVPTLLPGKGQGAA